MKFMKRMGALALGAALAVSLTACGGGGADKSAAEAINAANEKANAAKSMSANMVMEMSMTAADQTIDMNTTMQMDCIMDPMKLRANASISMGPLGSMDMVVYAQANGDKYTTYTSDGVNWIVEEMSQEELGQYDAHASMDMYLENAEDFKADGTEELSGGTADRYQGVIRGDALKKVIENSGSMDSMTASMGPDAAAMMETMFKDLGDMPITIWIDQATGYPARFYMDMSDVMSKMMTNLEKEAGQSLGVTFNKVVITLDYTGFDSVEDFEIPAEALEAAA